MYRLRSTPSPLIEKGLIGVEKYPFLGMKYEKESPKSWAVRVDDIPVSIAKISKFFFIGRWFGRRSGEFPSKKTGICLCILFIVVIGKQYLLVCPCSLEIFGSTTVGTEVLLANIVVNDVLVFGYETVSVVEKIHGKRYRRG